MSLNGDGCSSMLSLLLHFPLSLSVWDIHTHSRTHYFLPKVKDILYKINNMNASIYRIWQWILMDILVGQCYQYLGIWVSLENSCLNSQAPYFSPPFLSFSLPTAQIIFRACIHILFLSWQKSNERALGSRGWRKKTNNTGFDLHDFSG